ncbi:MAG: hypothetical protein J7L88_01960 [Thermoplasmata archaeon]|nr:hypothetical protein [Thermoplasmata archaeon]
MTLYLVKLGGSRITDKGGEMKVDRPSLKSLAQQIREWWDVRGDDALILVHGAGSFGHSGAKRMGVVGGDRMGRVIGSEDLPGIAQVHREVRELHMEVLKSLTDLGLPAYSHPPYPSATWEGEPKPGRSLNITHLKLTESALRGLIPVTMGDLIEDPVLAYSVVSGDHLIRAAAEEALKKGYAVKIIFVMSERGIRNENGNYIKKMNPDEAEKLLISLTNLVLEDEKRVADVTGGIFLKLSVGIHLSKKGVEVVYTDGEDGALLKELKGRSERASRII